MKFETVSSRILLYDKGATIGPQLARGILEFFQKVSKVSRNSWQCDVSLPKQVPLFASTSYIRPPGVRLLIMPITNRLRAVRLSIYSLVFEMVEAA